MTSARLEDIFRFEVCLEAKLRCVQMFLKLDEWRCRPELHPFAATTTYDNENCKLCISWTRAQQQRWELHSKDSFFIISFTSFLIHKHCCLTRVQTLISRIVVVETNLKYLYFTRVFYFCFTTDQIRGKCFSLFSRHFYCTWRLFDQERCCSWWIHVYCNACIRWEIWGDQASQWRLREGEAVSRTGNPPMLMVVTVWRWWAEDPDVRRWTQVSSTSALDTNNWRWMKTDFKFGSDDTTGWFNHL